MSRIFLVDDEESIRETVGFALGKEGYSVSLFADGAAAWDAFERTPPDLVIADIMMPRMDGLELCRRLRARSEELPIIFLTSRDDEFDRVLGLELGADDYLCKPFSIRELQARVKVLLRRLTLIRQRAPETREELLEVGPLRLDLQRYVARWRDQPLPLTVTEFMLLRALARRPGHVKSRTQLMEDAYAQDTFVSERTIDSHIKRLRKKFNAVDPEFDRIDTVHGLGYRYVQD
jgi:two-component system response regulator ChvI